jgi:hypothetical protein
MSHTYYNLYDDHKKVKLKAEQLTTKNLGQIFGLFPDTIYLMSDDGTVETPDADTGAFEDLWSFHKYQVHGEFLLPKTGEIIGSQQTARAPSTMSSRFMPSGSFLGSSKSGSTPRPPKGISAKTKWPPKKPGVSAGSAKQEWTKNIEVHHYNNGMLQKFSNFPVILAEATATIKHVSQQLSFEAFEGNNVILLDNDNLQVPDTVASRGRSFYTSISVVTY